MIRPRHIIKAAGHGDHGDDWRERGACLKEDPELFFVPGDTSVETKAGRAQIADAKAVCRPCPVKAECLKEALDEGLQGVWGGTDDLERKALRRRDGIKDRPVDREPPPCGTYRGYLSHRHYGEPVDEACERAKKDAESKRRQRARQKAMSA